MTYVFHAPDGTILYTADFAPGTPIPPGDHIEVEAAPADLHRWRVEDGALVAIEALTEDGRAEAIAAVNRLRGEARARFITVLPGQEMVYLDKERQALAFLADPDPQPADYPAIFAEVGVTGETAHQVAQVVASMGAQWRQVSALIEGACLGAIATIETAETWAQADAAVAGAALALEALP